MHRHPLLVTAAAMLMAACGSSGSAATPTVPTTPTTPTTPNTPTPITVVPHAPPAVIVQGNTLVDASGARLRLRGVNRSGGEFMCSQGRGIFDGPTDTTSVKAIAAWKVNVVRVPLNETCWLGINGVKPEYGGVNYQKAVSDYVANLNRYGIVVILELHWNGPDTVLALKQAPMPDRDHTPEFWKQLATAYKGNASVVFDLFNEPFPDNNSNSAEAWRCWKSGGTCSGMTYQAAGMDELVATVRATGATNVIMLGGVGYSSRLSGWLANKPNDPLKQLAASWHVYNFSGCNQRSCWDAEAAPVDLQVPLVLGEVGQDDLGSAFITSLMDWMDARQGSYLAWVWNVWGTKLDLITSYDGTATSYGSTFRTRYLSP
ncbi:MAG: cellulase family glycosylhydrolase [bacterium]